MFFFILIPILLLIMIIPYDKIRNNIMSQLKRTEFLAKIEAERKRKEEERKRREAEERELQRQRDTYANNPWRQFEIEVADLFERRWREVQLWPGSNDGWIDIIIRWSDIYVVQCKHYWWNKFVWPKHIRDFQWAIDLFEAQHNLRVEWIFITSWKTTYYARETAKSLWIRLWDKWNRRDRILSF